jgi:multicomponent Na+:H+ antiporter subunit A
MTLSSSAQTLLVLALPFLAAFVAPAVIRRAGDNGVWLLAAAPAAVFLFLFSHAETIAQGQAMTGGVDWIEPLGARLSYRIDGLSLTFGLLITGIGTLIILYSGGYLKGHAGLGRFLSFMFLFMGSMLGLVMADNLFALLVLWELTSITSFLLIGFDHNRRASRRAAIQALVVTGGGGLALIAAVFAIQHATGHTELSGLLASGEALRQSPLYGVIFWLVIAGAFTKSAQFPLHFWLPNAMEAPTPVSAYLHSATMVKAGVYLLMRLNPAMGGTWLWETVLPLVGAATLLAGALLAIRQTDLKLMLAQTTVASLGLLVLLTGFGGERAVEAAVYYLFAHALFKGAFFMIAGSIDHQSGTRDIRELGGLARAMPVTFACACLAGLSMAGIPPFIGFLAKEEVYAATAGAAAWPAALTVAIVIGNGLMLAIAAAVAVKPFLGQFRETPKKPHEGPVLLWAGFAVLTAGGLASAIFASYVNHSLIAPMASAVAGRPLGPHAALGLHLGAPLLLSGVTVLFGALVYQRIAGAREAIALMLRRIGWGPDLGFDQVVEAILRLSAAVTAFLQNGRLEAYMTAVFIVGIAALFAPMLAFDELPALPHWPQLTFYEWGVILLALAGLGAVISASDRLTAIVSLGIQGFAVALIFMLFGAPDLAFTQFMVETLSVVILALVMTRLTLDKSDHRPLRETLFDGAVSLSVAVGLGLLLLAVTQLPFNAELSEFFAQHSYAIAHGRNIVNVIIVDFRGLDTLGEIAVVMIAGLAILALISIRHRPAIAKEASPAPSATTYGKFGEAA